MAGLMTASLRFNTGNKKDTGHKKHGMGKITQIKPTYEFVSWSGPVGKDYSGPNPPSSVKGDPKPLSKHRLR